jgi:hypothetical protein
MSDMIWPGRRPRMSFTATGIPKEPRWRASAPGALVLHFRAQALLTSSHRTLWTGPDRTARGRR